MGDRIVTFERGQDQRVNLLLSYHYFKRLNMAEFLRKVFGEVFPSVFLDSGAWSAFTMGVTIKLDDYIGYCHANAPSLWTYCNLDDMKQPEITLANQREMERQGLSPMPVFHVGEDFKYLEAYAAEYDHVAIGRIVPFTGRPKVIIPYLGKCFRIVAGRAKVHGLGVSNTTLLRLFPWATTDSSAWGSGFRFGAVHLFDPLSGDFKGFGYKDHRAFNHHQERLREHNFERFNFLEVEGSPRSAFGGIVATSYLKMNEWMKRRHGNDYKFFFVCTTNSDADYVRDAALATESAA
jgi:hypothetical protein